VLTLTAATQTHEGGDHAPWWRRLLGPTPAQARR
jgi:hypothetical protein